MRRARRNLLVPAVLIAVLIVLLIERSGLLPALHGSLAVGYQWLMLLAGVALLLGVVNVAWLHLRRIQAGQRDWPLSLVLIALMLAIFVAGVVNPYGATSPIMGWVFDSIVAPGQAALFSLLIFFIAAAAFRYLRIGRPGGAWMLIGALIILLVQWPIATDWLPANVVNGIFWLVDAPVMAALRGLLLGTGVAMLVIGLRLLTGRS
jgi:hypothetical protein